VALESVGFSKADAGKDVQGECSSVVSGTTDEHLSTPILYHVSSLKRALGPNHLVVLLVEGVGGDFLMFLPLLSIGLL